LSVSDIFCLGFGDSLIWISDRDVDACRMMSDYMVEMVNDGMQEFFVEFWGLNEGMGFDTQSRFDPSNF
jgi:hypothetical protein